MNDVEWMLAANKHAAKIVNEEAFHDDCGCFVINRSHTQGRPTMNFRGRKITIAQALAMPGKGQHTRHLCHNQACVNPGHLVVGTPSQNAHDAYDVGDLERGARHPQALPLTDDQVTEIRADPRSQRVIAKEYGIAQSTIGQIKRREGRWANSGSDEDCADGHADSGFARGATCVPLGSDSQPTEEKS